MSMRMPLQEIIRQPRHIQMTGDERNFHSELPVAQNHTDGAALDSTFYARHTPVSLEQMHGLSN